MLYITPFQIKAALPVQAAAAVAQNFNFFIGQHNAYPPPFYFEQSLFLIQLAHLFFQIGLILHSGMAGVPAALPSSWLAAYGTCTKPARIWG